MDASRIIPLSFMALGTQPRALQILIVNPSSCLIAS